MLRIERRKKVHIVHKEGSNNKVGSELLSTKTRSAEGLPKGKTTRPLLLDMPNMSRIIIVGLPHFYISAIVDKVAIHAFNGC